MTIIALPCPFCGHSSVSVCEGSTFRWRIAGCNECGASAGEVRHNTLNPNQVTAGIESHDSAIAEWNKRMPPKEPT